MPGIGGQRVSADRRAATERTPHDDPQGLTPTEEELADARRSGQLAAREEFPVGVCPFDPRRPDQQALAQVWVAAYTDALPDGGVGERNPEEV